jgi:hypothetical protein
MKKNILLTLFVLCNIYASIAQSNDWFKVKDTDAAYTISYPEEPQQGSDDVPTDKGTVKMNTYTLQPDGDDNLIYMSSFTEYPESFFPNKLATLEKQDEVLENSVNGAVTNTQGKLISEDKIYFNGYRGRDIKIAIDGGYIIKMKVLLVGIKLYLAQVIYKEENDNNANQKRFFDSLELINVKE